MNTSRRGLLTGAAAALAAGPALARRQDTLRLTGNFVQGGHAIGTTWPGALVFVDGEALTTASSDGIFIVGFDRDQTGSVQIEARSGDRSIRRVIDIARVDFPSTRIDGLPAATVTPSDPALLDRIRREVALKTEGFASRIDADHFSDGFTWPLDHGQGLITAYLHQSRIDVAVGQDLQRGDVIGRVGMTGRATGPHLCWRAKWRDRNLDPSLFIRA